MQPNISTFEMTQRKLPLGGAKNKWSQVEETQSGGQFLGIRGLVGLYPLLALFPFARLFFASQKVFTFTIAHRLKR